MQPVRVDNRNGSGNLARCHPTPPTELLRLAVIPDGIPATDYAAGRPW